MKNDHGVEPTRYMKRKESREAINCNNKYGPIFGINDIFIANNCNKKDACMTDTDNMNAYECHPKYKSSLFLNSTRSDDNMKYFTVFDYEVYGIENYKDYIYNTCKCPDIIWKYIETQDISEESLKQFDDESEIRNDLDLIRCKDNVIRAKISQYYFKNPSEFLPNTQIVDKQYDPYLKEWLGSDYNWKLIFRASEHKDGNQSFHECCDDKGPTLIVVKSREGWIFGGYTTQSWSGEGIYYDMLYDNQ